MGRARSASVALTAGTILGAAAWHAPSLAAHVPRLVPRSWNVATRLAAADLVALTFDDGPQSDATAAVLDELARLDVPATFFCVGDQVDAHADVVRDMVASGHAVQSHGWRHRNHLLRDPREITRDVRAACDVIGSVTGTTPSMFRPPQGAINPVTIHAAHHAGQPIVLWSRWARDWERRSTVVTNVRRLTDQLRGGDILLLHDGNRYGGNDWRTTRDSIAPVVDRVRRAGLEFVALTRTDQLA